MLVKAAGLFCLLFTSVCVMAQNTDKSAHLKYVQQLESKDWIVMDTIVVFDPATKEETMQVVKNDFAPFKTESGEMAYRLAEQMPEFPGGSEELATWLLSNRQTPPLKTGETAAKGTVQVRFLVLSDGQVDVSSIAVGYNDLDKPYEQAAVSTATKMPRWIPAQHKGKAVPCMARIIVSF